MVVIVRVLCVDVGQPNGITYDQLCKVITVSIHWSGSGASPTHDIWVAPGGLDLESSTAFVEPATPLKSMVVFEL